MSKTEWILVSDRLPEGDCETRQNEIEVVGFNKDWIHPDFNPLGQRMCCVDDFGWYSARWNASNDCYMNVKTDEKDNPTHWRPLEDSPKE